MLHGVVFLFLALVATCVAILSRSQRPRDIVPDYLGRCTGTIFERDGLCFTVSLDAEDQIATFTIMYQNRYDRPGRHISLCGPPAAAWRPFRHG